MAYLDPVLGWLLYLNSLLGIILISFIISLIIILAYKYFTNQTLMKELKENSKKHQEEMKLHKSNPEKMMEIQKRAMDVNMKYMLHSLKPTLITFIPIIIIFSWLNANMAYTPLQPELDFPVELSFLNGFNGNVEIYSQPSGIQFVNGQNQSVVLSKASFILRGKEGEYNLKFKINGEECADCSKIVKITSQRKYEQPVKILKNNVVKKITFGNEKIIYLNLFGWKLGWLGSYIIFSLVFSLGLRKVLKVY